MRKDIKQRWIDVRYYIDRNFAHVFVLTLMVLIPFVVYPPLEGTILWTVFLAFYFLANAGMVHHRGKSREFRKLNLNRSLWTVK